MDPRQLRELTGQPLVLVLLVPSPAAGPLGGDPAGDEHSRRALVWALIALTIAWLVWSSAKP